MGFTMEPVASLETKKAKMTLWRLWPLRPRKNELSVESSQPSVIAVIVSTLKRCSRDLQAFAAAPNNPHGIALRRLSVFRSCLIRCLRGSPVSVWLIVGVRAGAGDPGTGRRALASAR